MKEKYVTVLSNKALARKFLAGAYFFTSFLLFQSDIFAQLSLKPAAPAAESPPQQSKAKGPSLEGKESRSVPGDIHAHSFGVGLGETFLVGKFRDYGNDSITFDAYYTYSASHSFELLINGHYSKHTQQQEYTSLQGAVVAIKAKLYQFDAFSPYVLAGPGFYRPKVKRYVGSSPQLLESQGKMAFGMNLGAGADLKLNDLFSVGLIAHYHNPFDIKQDVGPDVEGSYFKLLMTVMYYL